MYSTISSCQHCASEKRERTVVMWGSGKLRHLWFLEATIALAGAFNLLLAGRTHGFTVLTVALPTLFTAGASWVITMYTKYTIIGHPLYLFPDPLGHVHSEEAFPVSVEPTHRREKSTLAAGRVLRVCSGLFRRDGVMIYGIVEPSYVSRSDEFRVVPFLRDDETYLDVVTPQVTLRTLQASSVFKLLAQSRCLQQPTHNLVIFDGVVNERDALVKKCEALSADNQALRKVQTEFASALREAKAERDDAHRIATNLTEEMLYEIGLILANKSKRTKQNHPGAIRVKLEQALRRQLSAVQVIERIRALGPAEGAPYLQALATSEFFRTLAHEARIANAAALAPTSGPAGHSHD